MRPSWPRTARRFGGRSAALLVTTALALATPLPADAGVTAVERPASLVDPLIGSANNGTTYPGATLPQGMIGWSPTSTTGDQTGTGAANGYRYDVTRIRGLSLTHVNGAGCNPGAAGDVPIMPYVGDVTSSPSADTKDAVYAADFSHTAEKAVPGRYSLGLASGASADLAVSRRAGVADFTFPADRPANLLFRVSNSLNGSEDAQVDIDTAHRRVTGSVLTGASCAAAPTGAPTTARATTGCTSARPSTGTSPPSAPGRTAPCPRGPPPPRAERATPPAPTGRAAAPAGTSASTPALTTMSTCGSASRTSVSAAPRPTCAGRSPRTRASRTWPTPEAASGTAS